MIIIGIDPAMSATALVALDVTTMKVVDSLLIETSKTKYKQIRANSDTISRCKQLHRGSEEFINKFPNAFIAGEAPSGSQSSAASKSYGISCFLLAVWDALEVTPDEVKKASVGTSTASKAQMIEWAVVKHPELTWKLQKGKPINKNEHLADALGVIYAAMKLPEFKRLQNAYQDHK